MNMQYWRNNDDHSQIYAFDISDESQVAARDKLLDAGSFSDITSIWPLPQPAPVLPTAEQNKKTAALLLQQTDWTEIPSVTSSSSNPRLLNGSEFIAYRGVIRQIAVYPTEGNLNWPSKPEAHWSE